MPLKEITIYTDGGCHGNPGPGGWGVILQYGPLKKELSGGERDTSNNRMELRAAIAGLASLKESCVVTVYTDSQYVRRGILEWIHKWKARGWMRTASQPVKNADLWRELDAQASRHHVKWKWLKGHAGHPENERCDELAGAEIGKLRHGRSACSASPAISLETHSSVAEQGSRFAKAGFAIEKPPEPAIFPPVQGQLL